MMEHHIELSKKCMHANLSITCLTPYTALDTIIDEAKVTKRQPHLCNTWAGTLSQR
jgi:hypothetical protein